MDEDWRVTELRALGASIGSGVYFGPEVYIENDFAPLLTVGDGVVISQGATVLLHDSALNNLTGAPIEFGAVVLEAGCYIGANVTILCGARIGAGSLVGACSLVTGDIPPGVVAVGQPARVVTTVDEVVDRHSRWGASDARRIYVPALPWRDRTADDFAALDEDVAVALGRTSSEKKESTP